VKKCSPYINENNTMRMAQSQPQTEWFLGDFMAGNKTSRAPNAYSRKNDEKVFWTEIHYWKQEINQLW